MKIMTYAKFPLNVGLVKKARVLSLAGGPTRIRILCFMFRYHKACVSDIAESLGMGIAGISHHLQLMRDNGFFVTERLGQNICYILVASDDVKYLEKIICGNKGRLLNLFKMGK